MEVQSMSPKILIVSGTLGTASEVYRCNNLQEQLICADYLANIITFNHPKLLSIASLHDIIVLHRVPYDGFIDRLFELRKTIVFDIDDLVFDPDAIKHVDGLSYLTPEEIVAYKDGVARHRETLLRSDYVFASTEFLAGKIKKLGKDTFVVANCISDTMIKSAVETSPSRDPSRIVIGYMSGTRTHDKDFLEAADSIICLLEEFDNLEFWVQGYLQLDQRFSCFKDKIRHLPFGTMKDMFNTLGHIDIAIAPLEPTNPYCRAKSEIKYYEAALKGVPLVASRIDSFINTISHGDNGMLANGTKEWTFSIRSLVTDPDLRRNLGRNAKKDVLRNHTSKARMGAMKVLIQQLTSKTVSLPQQKTITKYRRDREGLNLGWCIPTPFKGSGGHMTIFRNIKYLEKFGHKVTIYVFGGDRTLPTSKKMKELISQDFVPLEADIVIGWDLIEPCDALFATHYTTAPFVASSEAAKKKFYFVQDFEPYFFPMGSEYIAVENTYKLGLSCITIGRWLTRKLLEDYAADANYFDFAVDNSVYYPRCEKSDKIRILFYAQPDKPRRGFEIGVAALKRLHQLHSDSIEIVLFGSSLISKQHIPFPHVNAGILNFDQLAEIYSSAHIGLVISLSNPSLIPFDMMACGCAVVDIARENNFEDYVNGKEILLAEPTPDGLVKAINRLIIDDALRDRITEAARRLVSSRSYEKSARRLEAHILKGMLTDFVSDSTSLVDVNQSLSDSICGEILAGTYIGQSFISSKNNLFAVDLLFATFQRSSVNDAMFKLLSDDDIELFSTIIPGDRINDNTWLRIAFPAISDSKGKKFKFSVEGTSASANSSFTLYMNSKSNYQEGIMSYNNNIVNGNLTFKTNVRIIEKQDTPPLFCAA
jgi:glycosyltransferase involved in cell wall biosynthesis